MLYSAWLMKRLTEGVSAMCVLNKCRTLHKLPLALAAKAERASHGPPSLPCGTSLGTQRLWLGSLELKRPVRTRNHVRPLAGRLSWKPCPKRRLRLVYEAGRGMSTKIKGGIKLVSGSATGAQNLLNGEEAINWWKWCFSEHLEGDEDLTWCVFAL